MVQLSIPLYCVQGFYNIANDAVGLSDYLLNNYLVLSAHSCSIVFFAYLVSSFLNIVIVYFFKMYIFQVNSAEVEVNTRC